MLNVVSGQLRVFKTLKIKLKLELKLELKWFEASERKLELKMICRIEIELKLKWLL